MDLEFLYKTLQGRYIPEYVYDSIKEDYPANKMSRRWYSYMSTEFQKPQPISGPVNTLRAILGFPPVQEEDCRDIKKIRFLLLSARSRVGMNAYHTDYKNDRLNREQRKELGVDLSRRQYNKIFRLVSRIEQEANDLEHQWLLFRLGRFAKTSFASQISWEDFSADEASAAFTAYYTANLGRRSTFTAGKQARAFDEIAAGLLDRVSQSPHPRWNVVAAVFPREDVLSHLNQEELFNLLLRSYNILKITSELLRLTVLKSNINTSTMIVHGGNDSSTWNVLAGAWNRARDFWMAVVVALGQEESFNYFLPGKVMRLMAGDVARWHTAIGGGLDPDTCVWAELRKPWNVMSGMELCSRLEIEETCKKYNIDPVKSGWSYPRSRNKIAPVVPTPELVHGIEVRNPELALWFRKIGIFSGQKVRQGQVDKFYEEYG